MAEDSAAGEDAQFTIIVDAQQIGGVQTVTASQSSGQTEQFNFYGNYTPGDHTVTVTFTNNYMYPGTPGDRNLYIDGVAYDGQTVSNSTTAIYNLPLFPPNSWVGDIWGNAQCTVHDTTSADAARGGTQTTTPGAVSRGSGPDKLALNMAEDPYQGDAQFTVSVDGQQIGGAQTTTAVVAQGQQQEFDIYGNFGAGTHDVAVDYLNDNVGGYYPAGTQLAPNADPSQSWARDTKDRNLYVMSASLNGGANASNTPWELSSSGVQHFSVTSGGSNSSSPDTISASSRANASASSLSFIADASASGSTASPDAGASSSAGADASSTITGVGSGGTADFPTPSASSAAAPDTSSSGSLAWTQYQPDHGTVMPTQS